MLAVAWARVREERQPCGRKVSRWVGAGCLRRRRVAPGGAAVRRPGPVLGSRCALAPAGRAPPARHRGALSKAAVSRPGKAPAPACWLRAAWPPVLRALQPPRPGPAGRGPAPGSPTFLCVLVSVSKATAARPEGRLQKPRLLPQFPLWCGCPSDGVWSVQGGDIGGESCLPHPLPLQPPAAPPVLTPSSSAPGRSV